jgi:hypothetical protein
MEKTGAIDVYFEEAIEILVEQPEIFSVADVKKVLEENEIKFSVIERAAGL